MLGIKDRYEEPLVRVKLKEGRIVHSFRAVAKPQASNAVGLSSAFWDISLVPSPDFIYICNPSLHFEMEPSGY